MSIFYLAKLNINEKILENQTEFKNVKFSQIPDFLTGRGTFDQKMKVYYSKKTNNVTESVKSIGWKFTDVKREDQDIISGNLIKITSKQSLVFGDKSTSRTMVEVRDDIEAVRFFYYIDKEIFAFQSTASIPYQGTPQKIEKIFQTNDSGNHIGELKVILKTETNEITGILTSGVIKKFEMDFIIPNDKKTTHSIADVLVENDIKSAQLKGNNEEGIESVDENGNLTGLIKEIVDLMHDGYAKASFWISKDAKSKKKKKITSKTLAQKRDINIDNLEDIKDKMVS